MLEGYLGKHRSYYEFGREEPTEQDWKDWKKALKSITISAYHGLMIPLGKWVARLPRIWRIFWDSEGNNNETVSDTEGLIIYQNDNGRGYFRARDNVEASPKGVQATVESSSKDSVKLRCTGDRHFYKPEEESKSFIKFLHSWGGKWMWEDLRLDEDPS